MTEQMRNPVNIERRFTHRRRFHYRRAGIAADKSPPKAKAMNRHARNRPTRHINISWLARRLGIPIFTAITPQLLACYGQSPESVAARPRWLWDLLGAARHALSGHPPCRQSTPAAELYHIECSTLFPGRMQRESIRCCVALSDDEDGNVRLTFCLSAPTPNSFSGKTQPTNN